MSSILKALKKIEQEESRDGKGASVWPDPVHSTRKSIEQKSRKKIVIFSRVFACCILAGVIIYIGSKINLHGIPDNKTAAKTGDSVYVLKNPAQKKRSPDKVLKKPSAFFERPKQINRNGQKKENQAENADPAVIAKRSLGGSFDAGKTEPVMKKPNLPAHSLPDVKKDSRVNIQAIAWAEEPARRFAVINSSIIREGGSIDGITVVSIEEDMVLFNENGSEWRQRFVVR